MDTISTFEKLGPYLGDIKWNVKHTYSPRFKAGEEGIQSTEAENHIRKAKRFLLDIKKAQSFYDGEHEDTFIPEFVLPFDNCLFAFEEPLVIKWMDKETTGYTDNKLLAINIFKR